MMFMKIFTWAKQHLKMAEAPKVAWLIAGLGNPGNAYSGNRHNVGFLFIKALGKKYKLKFDKKQRNAKVTSGNILERSVILAMPQTFMNLSGQAIRSLSKKHCVPLERIIVIHDDIDLPLGKMRIKQGGGHGGHNGIRSVVQEMQSPEFIRIRLGVGRPPTSNADEGVTGHVLGNFNSSEKRVLEKLFPITIEAVETIIADGLNEAMNKYSNYFADSKD